mgnify:CR=1 FL=1
MESGSPYRLIDLLLKHEVPFVVIGGHAVTFHGYVRSTEDVDIVFQRTDDSEDSLLDALLEVHAKWIGNEIDPETQLERLHDVTIQYVRSSHVMMVVTDYGYLDIFDFIPGFPGEDVADLLETAIDIERGKFASLEWLRRMKAASGRAKDKNDLEHLGENA